MKLMLANVLARDTNLLLLDEPASPLDPLMRDKLCDLIRQYLEAGNGENTVFFSTHNISDMENVTDYAIIMSHGKIIEEGFVEDLIFFPEFKNLFFLLWKTYFRINWFIQNIPPNHRYFF